MKRLLFLAVVAVLALSGAGVGLSATAAKTLCVGSKPGCFATIQAAVNSAGDGDTISIPPGTYAGGVTIDVSIRLQGAGAGRTAISGGGSVLTIGVYGASSEPTVSIDGMTITGGVARSSPESTPFTGQDGVIALGGGVEIPPNADFSGGATVTISNSVISGNRVAPTTAIASGIPCPPDITIPCINDDLPFALAAGGGIDSWGTLTLANTTVSNNLVGAASGLSAVASDAYAGAIQSWLGPVAISNSSFSHNQVSATAPNGRFADSGAIFLEGGALAMSNSSVTDNAASLSAAMPNDVASGTLAVAGGVHLGGGVTSATIRNTTISGNSLTMTNSVGDANAFSGGLHTDVNFDLENDAITNNSVDSQTLPGSSGNAYADSGAGEMGGTIANTRLSGNSVIVDSSAGDAHASAGALIFGPGTMMNSVISGNTIHATSPNGSASVSGGGLQQGDVTTLANMTVSGNSAEAEGLTAIGQGGGIFAAPVPNGPPAGPLTLLNSTVTGNKLSGSAGATLQGGGLYTQNEPVTLAHTVIAHNIPDQCYVC
jgi:hypothetical protein